ncbi:hypothetical protein JOB18_029634 [Solea senegalensis]|uniref:Uncharacterized protein n=1 Tax=Solea senegalensis TaxID=28829 RepID=A0AAV6QQI3_SOLSE|nr:hypothetical protein JOB18_029634 [Solea senegalensis]
MADLLSSGEEGAVNDENHKRVHSPTNKGFEEKLHRFINVRRSKLRLLSDKSNQVERLMEDDDNWIHVEQKEMKSYKKLYEEFVELNQSVKLYLKEDEIEDDQTFWFEPEMSNCQDFMKRVETWVGDIRLCEDLIMTSVKDINPPTDSVSHVSVKQKSGKSSGRSSRASSHSSTATSLRLREEANRAALVANAAELKEKQMDQELEEGLVKPKTPREPKTGPREEGQLKPKTPREEGQLKPKTPREEGLVKPLKISADYEAPQQQFGPVATTHSRQQDGVEGKPVLPTNAPVVKIKVRADQRPAARNVTRTPSFHHI